MTVWKRKNFGLVPEIFDKVNKLHILYCPKSVLTRERFRDNFATLFITSLMLAVIFDSAYTISLN